MTGVNLRPPPRAAREKRSTHLLRRALTPAAKVATGNWRQRLLVAGNPLSSGFDGIAFAPDQEPAKLWPAVAKVLYRIRRAERLTGQTHFVMITDLAARERDAHFSAASRRRIERPGPRRSGRW